MPSRPSRGALFNRIPVLPGLVVAILAVALAIGVSTSSGVLATSDVGPSDARSDDVTNPLCDAYLALQANVLSGAPDARGSRRELVDRLTALSTRDPDIAIRKNGSLVLHYQSRNALGPTEFSHATRSIKMRCE